MGDKYLHVYGHPRSGNNLLMHFIARNFYPGEDLSTPPGRIGHYAERVRNKQNPVGMLGGTHHFFNYEHQRFFRPLLYVYRDGRDVMVSLWKTKSFLHPDWRELSFSEFLRMPLDWWGSPGNDDPYGKSAVDHWIEHLRSWEDQSVLMVRYRDIINQPAMIRDRIADAFKMEHTEKLHQIKKRVGWFPNRARAGAWGDVFKQGDLEFFFSICPPDFWGLDDRGGRKDD